jgi:hypothetical protein
MRGMFRLLVATLVIGGWSLAAMSLHVVQTHGGVQVITKNQLGVSDTFVDARQWSRQDEELHRCLYDRLRQLDRTEILDPSAPDEALAADTHAEAVKASWARLNREAAARRRN